MTGTAQAPEFASAESGQPPREAPISIDDSCRSHPPLNWEQMDRFPRPWRRPIQALMWLGTAAFGGVSLLAILTALATIPGGNLFVLGFLLDVEGRIIRGGKLRFAVPAPLAARVGAIVLGCGIWIAPVWLLAGVAGDARTVAPYGLAAWLATIVFAACAALVAVHLGVALLCGGSLGCFLRPLRNVRWLRDEIRRGGLAARALDRLQRFVALWRIPQRVWRGAIAYAAAVLWLAAPAALFTIVQSSDASTWRRVAMLVGALSLACVLSWVPFLQARFAAEERWRSLFELRSVRDLFGHAPLAWTLAIIVTYALLIPFYLYLFHFKMRLPPHDAVWDVMLLIVLTNYPSRIIVAWAYRRAMHKPLTKATWRWACRAILVGGLVAYVWLLSHTTIIGEHGRRSLFEHHAVVVPFP